MRCTQDYGLSGKAVEFLYDEAKRLDQCAACGRYDGFESEDIGDYGMFGELQYQRYHLEDGRTAEEFGQHCVWSSGPMIWLGLRVSDGTELLWDEEDMEE